MKFSVSQPDLKRGLEAISHAVAQRSSLPVLSNVLIVAEVGEGESANGKVSLSGTNLSIGVRCTIPASVSEPGSTTVPARLLSEFVNQLPNERIDMLLNAKTMTLNLKCARYDTNIKGIDATEFPLLTTAFANEKGTITLDETLLKDLITETAFCVSPDESRPGLMCVKIVFTPSQVMAYATDGFRMARAIRDVKTTFVNNIEVLIPGSSLTQLAKVLALFKSDGAIPVKITIPAVGNKVIFETGTVDFVAQVSNANYPNIESLLSRTPAPSQVTVNTKDLSKSLRVSDIFAREAANLVRISGTPPGKGDIDGELVVNSLSDSGDNIATIPATIAGPEFTIAFNARYLQDVLGAIKTETVNLGITRAAAPGVVTPVNGADVLYMVMPMHDTGAAPTPKKGKK